MRLKIQLHFEWVWVGARVPQKTTSNDQATASTIASSLYPSFRSSFVVRPFDLCSCYQLRQSSRGTGIMSKGSNIPLTFNNPTTTGFYLLPQTPHSYWSLETFDFSGLIHGRWGVGWADWKLIVRRRRRRGDILNYGPTRAGVSFFLVFSARLNYLNGMAIENKFAETRIL